jgi:ribosomal 50S subunit-recycling heat shock protein
MRFDKFLKVSRLIKRRTVAHDAAEAGRVTVNGREAKPSYQVKPGDVLELGFGPRTLKVEVTDIRENTRKEEAATLYREVP